MQVILALIWYLVKIFCAFFAGWYLFKLYGVIRGYYDYKFYKA